jgi:hypothetical protein
VEEYALINRSQMDVAYLEDVKQREKDAEFGLTNSSSTLLQSDVATVSTGNPGYPG